MSAAVQPARIVADPTECVSRARSVSASSSPSSMPATVEYVRSSNDSILSRPAFRPAPTVSDPYPNGVITVPVLADIAARERRWYGYRQSRGPPMCSSGGTPFSASKAEMLAPNERPNAFAQRMAANPSVSFKSLLVHSPSRAVGSPTAPGTANPSRCRWATPPRTDNEPPPASNARPPLSVPVNAPYSSTPAPSATQIGRASCRETVEVEEGDAEEKST